MGGDQNKEIRGKTSFMRGKGVIRRYRRYESWWLMITKCKNVWIVGMKNQEKEFEHLLGRIQSLEGRIQTFGLRRKGKNFRMKVKILSWNNWNVVILRPTRWKEGLKPVWGERNKTFEKGFTSLHQGRMVSNVRGKVWDQKKKKYSYHAFILFFCCTGLA